MYKLPLTIKQKIIMGFSTIGILLVAGSIFFYNSLNQISQANSNVELLAVPVQKQSNALQIKLLNMMKVGALGFTQTKTENLIKSEQEYAELNQEFQSAVTVLRGKLVDQPKMLQTLKQAQGYYQSYVSQSEKFYFSKKNVATANEAFEINYQKFLTSRDRASNKMLDLELLVLPGDGRLLEDIIGNGARIDDMLFTLQSTMSGLKQVTELDVLVQHKDDVSFLIANINNNYEFMQRLFTSVNDKSLLEEFAAEFATLSNLLVEPAELYQNKQQALDDFTNANLAYNLSVESFNDSYQQLTLLLSLAEARFDELQSATKSKVATGVNLAIYMAFIFVALATFIAVVTTRIMLGPLASANKSLALIAQGDLTQRLTITNKDEFGDLFNNINKLSDDLTLLLKNISQNAYSLDESSKVTSEQSHRIAQSTSAQITRVNNAKKIAEKMFISSSSVTDEANLTANNVSEASKHSFEIRTIADDNSNRIESLSTSLSDSVEVMARLSKHSDSIGGILDTIGSIADQTNLLALNAAIEAARAGEHGRGFAVVADEVRSLASRTQASTAEIQQMINSLQKETQTAEVAISQGQNKAGECVSQSKELNNAIKQIESALHTIDEMSKSISVASNEQLGFSQDIEVTMNEAAEAATHNAAESQDLSNRSDEVNKLAHSLTDSVARFKL
ncbi:methyl-accepting chemotaxis protein [Colwellia sp. Arc7-D]|jgi:methyl-accepting chemotaxis protein|uniref:methyl-accepting chemotaxis protein n=1 Tax=Colwellia sp. Arc7-D TaxID=2161872 RepID=UPI000D3829E7|nr:methyl-accepting chemotaxis protein [Colwellia sp. Arc7-D]AWB57113.1 methyl-accepting chemotaxis protein [Colwellia sp. Arc7-D]|tara:strand:- start:5496 stop:7529 length:2034 start_codon:yes stop_codon:yes gene_type:complete